ncbi:MAG: metal-dependent transcriptional regulator [Ruminococcaceae bacterium]|nr:metal-dependent transcriptional regulator [Oscillospiraceae bacterium]
MSIHESGENYLEAILNIRERTGKCRSVDIAKELGFSKPSVSKMTKELKENNFINIDKSNDISLSEKGMQIALAISERHEIIAKVLIMLGVPDDIALTDACKIEHDLSPASFERIKEYYNKHKN